MIGAVLLILSANASAQSGPLTLDDIHPNLSAIRDAILSDPEGHCLIKACRPIDLVYAATLIISERMDMMLGISRGPHSTGRPSDDQRWRPRVLSHPELFGAVCDTMTGLASRYQGNEAHMGENVVAAAMLELAGRIDNKNNHCLERVLAAFPHIPAADRAIEAARNFCAYSREPRMDCKRIAR
jgi:hypothetical protein